MKRTMQGRIMPADAQAVFQSLQALPCGCRRRGPYLCPEARALWRAVTAAWDAASRTADWPLYDEAQAVYDAHFHPEVIHA